jgi:hypothetical protein
MGGLVPLGYDMVDRRLGRATRRRTRSHSPWMTAQSAVWGDVPATGKGESLRRRVIRRHFDFLSEREEFGADCPSRAHCMVGSCGHREPESANFASAPQN